MISQVGCRFDWYEVTLDGVDDGRVPRALALALGGHISQGKGRNGYAVCEVVERDEVVLAQVYGHSAREGEVHITVTSDACDEVVPLIRRLYPAHRVSRADASVDFEADFDALDVVALKFARDKGIAHRLITDSDGGATRYLGAKSSELQTRIYRKSEQLRALHPDRAESIPDGIVRVELQARPGKRAIKEAVSTMTPDDLWGLGRWTQALALDVLNIDAERTSTHFYRPSDWSRAMYYLGKQYGPMIERRIEAEGIEKVRGEILAALGMGGSPF